MNSNNKAQGNPIGKATALLTPTERKKAGMAVAGVFAETLLEFAGIASLLPVLYYLLDDGGNRRAAVLFGLFAFAVLAVKWAAGTALARRRNRFLLDVYRRMSLTLFTAYYHRGLLFIRERGTRRLGYEVNNACLAFSQGVLAPLLRMTGDGPAPAAGGTCPAMLVAHVGRGACRFVLPGGAGLHRFHTQAGTGLRPTGTRGTAPTVGRDGRRLCRLCGTGSERRRRQAPAQLRGRVGRSEPQSPGAEHAGQASRIHQRTVRRGGDWCWWRCPAAAER